MHGAPGRKPQPPARNEGYDSDAALKIERFAASEWMVVAPSRRVGDLTPII